MLLDVLDNLPRVRISSALMQLIQVLWLLKRCRVPNVPSLTTLRKTQSNLRAVCDLEPETVTSSLGNVFTLNDPAKSIGLVRMCYSHTLTSSDKPQDIANPEVAANLHVFPEVGPGPVSEFWEAARMRECDRRDLSPMFARGGSHFYVDELAQLDDGSFVIPHMWVTYNGEICAMCAPVVVKDVRWFLISLHDIYTEDFVCRMDYISQLRAQQNCNESLAIGL
jgi:hypothetical protein